MKESLEQLAGLLREQNGYVDKMLTLSKERLSIIVSANIYKLDSLERQEFNVIKNINIAKKELTDLLQSISKKLGRSEMTVKEIIDCPGIEECNDIQRLRNELIVKLNELEYMHGISKELLDDNIKLTNTILKIMSKTDGTDLSVKLYDCEGNTKAEKKTTSGLVDVVISKNTYRMDSRIKERTL